MEKNLTSIWMDFASQLIARQKEKLSHNRLTIYGTIFLLSWIAFLFIDTIQFLQSHPEAEFLFAFTFISVFNFSGVFSLIFLTFLIQSSQSHQYKIQEILDNFSKYFLELPFSLLVISLGLGNLFDGFLAKTVGLSRGPYFAYVLFWVILGGLVYLHVIKKQPTLDSEPEFPKFSQPGIFEEPFRRKLFGFLLLLSCIFIVFSLVSFHDLAVFSGLFKKLVFLKASFLLTLFIYLSGFLLCLLSADYNVSIFKQLERKLLLESPDEEEIKLFYIKTIFDSPLKEWIDGLVTGISQQKKELSDAIRQARSDLEGMEKDGKGKESGKKDQILLPLKEKFRTFEESLKPTQEKISQIITRGAFNQQNGSLANLQFILSESVQKAKTTINTL